MEENIIHYNTDEIVCPYCAYYHFDSSFNIIEEEGEEACMSCGEVFTYRKNIFITYDTNKKENENT